MSKKRCECGFVMSTVSDANPYEGFLFSNEDVDTEDKLDIIMDSISVFECTECGRLSIQPDRTQNFYMTYKPENGKYNAILKS